MLNIMLNAIPNNMADIWYVYDLMLLLIIAVLIFVLTLLKRKSNLKEGNKNVKSAINILKRAKLGTKSTKVRIQLFTVKNLLKSAIYSFNICVNDEDMVNLLEKLDCLNKNVEILDEIIKNAFKEDLNSQIDDLITSLLVCQ